MEELKVLIDVLERDLEILDRLPRILLSHEGRCIQDERRKELESCKETLEIMEKYHSQLIEGCLI